MCVCVCVCVCTHTHTHKHTHTLLHLRAFCKRLVLIRDEAPEIAFLIAVIFSLAVFSFAENCPEDTEWKCDYYFSHYTNPCIYRNVLEEDCPRRCGFC